MFQWNMNFRVPEPKRITINNFDLWTIENGSSIWKPINSMSDNLNLEMTIDGRPKKRITATRK